MPESTCLHIQDHGIGPDSRRGYSLDFGPDRPRRVLRGAADRRTTWPTKPAGCIAGAGRGISCRWSPKARSCSTAGPVDRLVSVAVRRAVSRRPLLSDAATRPSRRSRLGNVPKGDRAGAPHWPKPAFERRASREPSASSDRSQSAASPPPARSRVRARARQPREQAQAPDGRAESAATRQRERPLGNALASCRSRAQGPRTNVRRPAPKPTSRVPAAFDSVPLKEPHSSALPTRRGPARSATIAADTDTRDRQGRIGLRRTRKTGCARIERDVVGPATEISPQSDRASSATPSPRA